MRGEGGRQLSGRISAGKKPQKRELGKTDGVYSWQVERQMRTIGGSVMLGIRW